MTSAPYTTGLHEVADGVFAWLQPDGGWGWSNAGLVRGDGGSLLVDTLFDLHLTRRMLEAMAPVTDTAPIATLVNTHANGDHCYGNQLVSGAEVVASAASAAEMAELPPAMLAAMTSLDLGSEAANAYVEAAFGPFDFEGIDQPHPDRTFTGALTLEVAGRRVELVDLGPAHTAGDVIAHLPDAGVVFTGDLCFNGGTPLVWNGPIANWVAAAEHIAGLDAEVIVPGHGPLATAADVLAMGEYLQFVHAEASARHAAGMSVAAAARDIDLGPYADWGESERIALNVDAVYREIDPTHRSAGVLALFALMGQLAAEK